MNGSSIIKTRVAIIFAICWIVWVILHSALLIWFGFDLNVAVIDGLVNTFFLAISCFLINNTLKYYQPRQNKYLYIAIMVIVISVACAFFTEYGLSIIQQPEAEYSFFLIKSIPIRFVIDFLTIGWMATISLLWYSQLSIREDDKRKADSEKLARDAELYNLRQQLQPHFLFNSLNSITALINNRPDEARDMVHKLSDFLRGTLRKEDQKPMPLAEELENLQLYLDIEKVRFGHRLDTVIDADDNCKQLMVPPLLLQPIVENAIKFGLYDTTGTVQIRIEATCIDNELYISVENPYDPTTVRPNKGTGFGLSGVKRRLYLLFGRADLLETQEHSNIFITKVKIPQ